MEYIIFTILFIYLTGCMVGYFFIDWWNLSPFVEKYTYNNCFQSWKIVYILFKKSLKEKE